ncbi:hypothetical protein OB905_10690 [Halobacteria archaeon AArc-dxtr1]|nr:hypothetical protein [Halobacteria archaeon AArc-dxtr1]
MAVRSRDGSPAAVSTRVVLGAAGVVLGGGWLVLGPGRLLIAAVGAVMLVAGRQLYTGAVSVVGVAIGGLWGIGAGDPVTGLAVGAVLGVVLAATTRLSSAYPGLVLGAAGGSWAVVELGLSGWPALLAVVSAAGLGWALVAVVFGVALAVVSAFVGTLLVFLAFRPGWAGAVGGAAGEPALSGATIVVFALVMGVGVLAQYAAIVRLVVPSSLAASLVVRAPWKGATAPHHATVETGQAAGETPPSHRAGANDSTAPERRRPAESGVDAARQAPVETDHGAATGRVSEDRRGASADVRPRAGEADELDGPQ